MKLQNTYRTQTIFNSWQLFKSRSKTQKNNNYLSTEFSFLKVFQQRYIKYLKILKTSFYIDMPAYPHQNTTGMQWYLGFHIPSFQANFWKKSARGHCSSISWSFTRRKSEIQGYLSLLSNMIQQNSHNLLYTS